MRTTRQPSPRLAGHTGHLIWGLAALAILMVGSADAAVFTVTHFNDTFDGVCADECSLRDAIHSAQRDPRPRSGFGSSANVDSVDADWSRVSGRQLAW